MLKESNSSVPSWSISQECTWLWGESRGYCIIKHNLVGSNGEVRGSDHSAYGYMSVGSAQAKSMRTSLITGYGGSSTIAWGYAMVSPLMSISISPSGDKFNVSVGGFGTELKNSGTNTLEWR